MLQRSGVFLFGAGLRRNRTSPMLDRPKFLSPMTPTLVVAPPSGPDWRHELKVDGFRAQAHIEADGSATLYSRAGADITRRFGLALLPIISAKPPAAIIDCELVACDTAGRPNFLSTVAYRRSSPNALRLVAFDLLAVAGTSFVHQPLAVRREALTDVVRRVGHAGLQMSLDFADGAELLALAEREGCEGVVSKRRDSLYVSGQSPLWTKVKTAAWRKANASRCEAFAQPGSRPGKRRLSIKVF
jgi:bifunctional non-homologous end joining protein LigD